MKLDISKPIKFKNPFLKDCKVEFLTTIKYNPDGRLFGFDIFVFKITDRLGFESIEKFTEDGELLPSKRFKKSSEKFDLINTTEDKKDVHLPISKL